mmetsp:Transcript_25863/g.84582  ORF Transcript_25863/g.84582 Transcript_25863/m.84582 type:complete len:262 (+) Transcript_25863:58-843(+)
MLASSLFLASGSAFLAARPSAHSILPGRLSASPTMGLSDGLEPSLRAGMSAASSKMAFGPPGRVLGGAASAWVLLFNSDQPDEGVYTMQSRPLGHGRRTYLVSFAARDDADSFASLLEADSRDAASPAAAPAQWSASQLQTLCHAARFQLAHLPAGGMLYPPSENEYDEAVLIKQAGRAALSEEPSRGAAFSAEERAKKRRRSSSAGQRDRNLPRAAERLAPRRAERGQAPVGQGDEEGRLAALRRQLEARWEADDADERA